MSLPLSCFEEFTNLLTFCYKRNIAIAPSLLDLSTGSFIRKRRRVGHDSPYPHLGTRLLLKQHFGNDYPEAEQRDKGDSGDNGFHRLQLP